MIAVINNYFFLTKKNDSSGKYSDPGTLLKVSLYNFSGLKNIKKGHIEMAEKFYFETLRSVLGCCIFHYCYLSEHLDVTTADLRFLHLGILSYGKYNNYNSSINFVHGHEEKEKERERE